MTYRYVDSFSLSIDSYDLNGEAIETYGPFASAIGDFAVSGNNLIFYIAGGKPDLVALYDLSEKEITKYLGTPSEEHYLLNLNKGAGGLAITGNKLAYLSADNLDFNLYDFDTAEAKTVIVDDSDFYNEEITNAIAIINNNRPLAVQYLMRNSYVKGLYAVGQNFAVIAEVGTMQMEANKLNTDQRFEKIYFFDNNFKYIGEIKSSVNFDEKFFSSNGSDLYKIVFELEKEVYEIEKLKLNN